MKKIKSILLIDDNDADNFYNKLIIESVGCTDTVHIAMNGKEAIDFLTTKTNDAYPTPSLIFLDLNMPIMNGWEFVEAYNELPESQKGEIILIMLTTSLNKDDVIEEKEIDDLKGCIMKPLTKEMLNNILEKHF